MIIRTKGVEKVCIISDHTTVTGKERYKNNAEKGIWYGPDLNYDDEGMLSGSLMTLENGVRNVMTHSGYGLCHAIRMASLNPAMAVGIDREVGSLEAGKRANLIIMDDAVNIKKVFLDGDLAVENGQLLI
jgi:N-acetylglucosamine-6-phosphate deacetylase